MSAIPDYDKLFKGFNEANISGIAQAHEIRLSASDDGNNVKMFYREYVSEDGWFPRPVIPTNSLSDTWLSYFPPADVLYGVPVKFDQYPLPYDHGTRQKWAYDVTYTRGDKQTHVLDCPSLPVDMQCDTLTNRLDDICRQTFNASFFKTKDKVKENVISILSSRNYNEENNGHITWWNQYFDNLPVDPDDPRYPMKCASALKSLKDKYMGAVQVLYVLK